MKKITILCSFFAIILCNHATFSQTTIEWETGATSSGNTITSTELAGVNITVSANNGDSVRLYDGGGISNSSGQIIYNVDAVGTELKISFDVPVNVISIYHLDTESTSEILTFTPTGGTGNSVKTDNHSANEGSTVSLNWTGITSFTITGSTFNAYVIDEMIAEIAIVATPVTLSTTHTNATANGLSKGTATVVASGGTPPYLYQWNDGQTTAKAIDLVAGSYTVTVRDDNGNGTPVISSTITIKNKPSVTSTAATTVIANGATINGNVTASGGETVTERGFVYAITATNSNPEIGGTGVIKVIEGNGTGIFGESITSLTKNTQYSFKAYATNSAGISYGVVQTFTTVNKADQTITFGALVDKNAGDAPFALTGTTSSGLTITYASSNTEVATVSGSTVTIVGAGSTNITASQAGNTLYNTASNVIQNLTVNKGDQVITFGTLAANKNVGYAAFALTATTSSGLTVTYTSSNTAVATVSGSTVTIIGAGSTNITASQAGNASYTPSSDVVQNLTINKGYQAITFGALATKAYSDAPFSLTGTTSSGQAVAYMSSNTAVATVSGNTVTITGAGSTDITASQAGNVNYNPATNIVQRLFVRGGNTSPTFTSTAITSVNEGSTYTYNITTNDVDGDAFSVSATTKPSWLNLTGGTTTVSSLAYSTGAHLRELFRRRPLRGVSVDASGNVYVADAHNHKISKISPSGVITTLAGSTAGFADGTGTAAQFYFPYGVYVDGSGTVYVADSGNHKIRKISPSGVVTTLAGSTTGFANGTGSVAQFSSPSGVAVDALGNVYVADSNNNKIRKISPSGVVTTLAGSTSGFANGTGTAAQFSTPTGVAVDALGNVYVADMINNKIRKITPAGVVTTLAGSTSGFADGNGTAAQFSNPRGVSVDKLGYVYVGDTGNNRIRKITPSGVTTTLAGSTAGFTEGTGTAAQFSNPYGVSVGELGTVYVADNNNGKIRKITQSAVLTGDATSQTGVHNVVLTADDGYGGTVNQSFSITVIGKPTITTDAATTVTLNGATLNGNVTTNGGTAITERGFVYAITATNGNPEIGGTGVIKVTDGTDTGVFSESITSLTKNILYSFNAYATNSIGTSYGVVKTFTTTPLIPLTITGLIGNNKKHDGTTVASVSGSAVLSGVLSSPPAFLPDEVNLSGSPVYTFATSNIGTGINISTTGYTLSGADSGKYTLIQPTLSASIIPASVSLPHTLTFNTTDNTNLGKVVSDGEGDSPDITGRQFNFEITDNTGNVTNEDVIYHLGAGANGLSVSNHEIYGMSIKTNDGSEFDFNGFTVNNFFGRSADQITITGYRDGSATGNISFPDVEKLIIPDLSNATFGNVDEVRITIPYGYYLGSFNDFRLAEPSLLPTITFANVDKTYGDANFDLEATSNSSGTISYSIIGTANGTSLSGTNNETVTLGNIGTVTIRATQGADGNFLSSTEDITLRIGVKTLTIIGLIGDNKIFDGTATATASGYATLSGLETGDIVSLGGTPVYTFTTTTIGTGISINTTGHVISGDDAGNYILTQPSLSADITIVLGVEDFIETGTELKLFPNPSNDFIQISGLTKAENYIIYNSISVKVLSGSILNNENIDIQNLNSGLYFLTIKEGKTIKFIKK